MTKEQRIAMARIISDKIKADNIIEESEIRDMMELMSEYSITHQEMENPERTDPSRQCCTDCSDTDRKDYEILSGEKVLAFTAEIITGCLLFLDNLRSLTEIAPVIVPYIDELEQMNRHLLPKIDSNIESLEGDIQRLEDNFAVVKKGIHTITPTIKSRNKEIEKIRKEMDKANIMMMV